MRGTAKGKIHPTFKKRLQELQENGRNQAASVAQEEQRLWQVPTDLVATDLLEISKLHSPSFDRKDINDNYVKCMPSGKDAGTTGDVASLKLQIDYNAAEERGFRLRHASVIRCICHGAARRRGMGIGPVMAAIEKQAADMLAQGGAAPPAKTPAASDEKFLKVS